MKENLADPMRDPGLDSNAPCPLCRAAKAKPDWTKFYRGYVCNSCAMSHTLRRLFACAIDLALIVSGFMALDLILRWGGGRGVEPEYFVLFYPPLLFKDGFRGKSPGKALFGLRVVNRDTLHPASLAASAKRNLLLVLPFGIGFILVLCTLNRRGRIGEGWAGTMVIEDRLRYHPIFTSHDGHCRMCAYDLTGNLSGRCPECGTERLSLAPLKDARTHGPSGA